MKRGRFLSLFAIFLCKCALIAKGAQKLRAEVWETVYPNARKKEGTEHYIFRSVNWNWINQLPTWNGTAENKSDDGHYIRTEYPNQIDREASQTAKINSNEFVIIFERK